MKECPGPNTDPEARISVASGTRVAEENQEIHGNLDYALTSKSKSDVSKMMKMKLHEKTVSP